MKNILGYKIRHTKTNLYLSSLGRGRWTKVGKTWPRKGDAIRAINNGLKHLSSSSWKKKEYESVLEDIPLWEFVELEETASYSALFLLDKLKT